MEYKVLDVAFSGLMHDMQILSKNKDGVGFNRTRKISDTHG